MPKFVIERAIPGVGASTAGELQAASQRSCGVLQELGPDVPWVHSYVTGDKLYCIYNAASAEHAREHARRAGFPADSIVQVVTIAGQGTDASGFGTRVSQLPLPRAFTILLRKPILALSVGALDVSTGTSRDKRSLATH